MNLKRIMRKCFGFCMSNHEPDPIEKEVQRRLTWRIMLLSLYPIPMLLPLMLYLYYSLEITRETMYTTQHDAIISILGRVNKLEKEFYKLEKDLHEYIGVTDSCAGAESRDNYNSELSDGGLSCVQTNKFQIMKYRANRGKSKR